MWWADLGHVPDLMDDVERGRHSTLMREADKQRFAIGAALLKAAAGALLDRPARSVRLDRSCPTCDRPHGKPRVIDGGDVELSLSHSGQRVGVAVTRGAAVGLDVEEITGRVDPALLGPTVLTAAESAPDVDTFLAYWTCKEAVVKATGDGLKVPLTTLTIDRPADPRPRLASWAGRPTMAGTMSLYRLDPGPGHLAAVAVLDPEPRPVHQHDAHPLLTAL